MTGKRDVNYRAASPLNLPERCGTCLWFRAGWWCEVVADTVTPLSVCNRWAARNP